jgi:hypothetical protein
VGKRRLATPFQIDRVSASAKVRIIFEYNAGRYSHATVDARPLTPHVSPGEGDK